MPPDSTSPLADWTRQLAADAGALEAKRLLRELRVDSGVDFTSNDYLSLNSSGRLGRLLGDIVRDWSGPVGSTGSRLLRGQHDAFAAAESAFAEWTGQPAALLFGSGYGANTGALPALITRRDHVFCDRLCHASLLDGIRLSGARRYYYEHDDPDDLARQLERHPPGPRGRSWVVSETVFSMDGDLPDLGRLEDVARAAGALLYLDEAHAVGLYGPGGAGRVRETGLADRVAVTVFPCGKAPGLAGAFVCGPPELKTALINRCRSFIFSTAQPPILAELLRRVIQLMSEPETDAARRRVFQLAGRLRDGLRERGLECLGTSQIVPVLAGDESRALEWMDRCRENGIDARAIRPPSVPPGTSRLRITVQAARTETEIDRLIEVLGAD